MGRQAGSQQVLKNLWMLRPGACNVHGTFQCDEGGICWKRRWLDFCVNLTKRHPSSGDLSPKVGLAGFFFSLRCEVCNRLLEKELILGDLGGLQRRMELSQKKQFCLQACSFGLCLRVPACLSWWLALLILDLLT